MNQNYDNFADEWIEIVEDSGDLDEQDFSSLTWDDELVRESHRTVSIRALRAAARGLSSSAEWSQTRGISFRWTSNDAA